MTQALVNNDVMLTKCPYCESIFEIYKEELPADESDVECGVCEQAFDALACETAVISKRDKSLEEITLQSAAIWDEEDNDDDKEPSNTSKPAPKQKNTRRVSHLAKNLKTSTSQTFPWAHAIGALCFAFIACMQWVHAERHTLATRGSFGQAIVAAYEILPWSVHPTWDPSDIDVPKRLDLQYIANTRDQSQSGALRARLTIKNTADARRPLPHIWLSLDNDIGQSIAGRMFRPEDYVGSTDRALWMPAQTEVQVILDLNDPGPTAAGFKWDICYPMKPNDKSLSWHCQYSS